MAKTPTINVKMDLSHIYRYMSLLGISNEIVAEVVASDEKFGPQAEAPDGTGPDSFPLGGGIDNVSDYTFARDLRDLIRDRTDRRFEASKGSWSDILLEEVFEAMAESDPELLRAELVQVGAMATKWIAAIDARA